MSAIPPFARSSLAWRLTRSSADSVPIQCSFGLADSRVAVSLPRGGTHLRAPRLLSERRPDPRGQQVVIHGGSGGEQLLNALIGFRDAHAFRVETQQAGQRLASLLEPTALEEQGGEAIPGNGHRRIVEHDFLVFRHGTRYVACLLYTSDAADDLLCVDLGGRRIIKKKKKNKN